MTDKPDRVTDLGQRRLAEHVLSLVDQHRETPFRSIEWLGDQLADQLAEALTTRSQPGEDAVLNDIAVMMSEFVDNWPQPKRVSTALALIAKTIRAALDPPRHKFWGAGEKDCPREIKAGNGELHTLRCKVCGEDNPRDQSCRAALNAATLPVENPQ